MSNRPEPATRHYDERLQHILKTAARIFAEKGFHRTSVRDIAMHRLGIGTTHDMRSIVSGLLWRSLVHREYTVAEKINLWRGKVRVGARLWDAQLSTDLSQRVPRLDIPVYFLHGVYDYTEARRYFDQLAAPVKGFYTFQHSAHSPLFEEPERMCGIVRRDVLRGATELADRP